jgi:hypothetical protein
MNACLCEKSKTHFIARKFDSGKNLSGAFVFSGRIEKEGNL